MKQESHSSSSSSSPSSPTVGEIQVREREDAPKNDISCTSNLLEQMYDFQKYIMFLQKWISNPQDLLQNRSLGTVPVLHCLYPHV